MEWGQLEPSLARSQTSGPLLNVHFFQAHVVQSACGFLLCLSPWPLTSPPRQSSASGKNPTLHSPLNFYITGFKALLRNKFGNHSKLQKIQEWRLENSRLRVG